MNLKSLESVLAIHREGSFVEAARSLGISQPAISMQIKALEDELGTVLFDRSVRPPAMTATGRALLDPISQVVALTRLIADVGGGGTEVSGAIEVGAVHTAMLHLAPEALGVVATRYPQVTIGVHRGEATEVVNAVLYGQLDAAVVPAPEEWHPEIHAEELLEDELVLVTPPSYRGARAAAPVFKLDREYELSGVVDHLAAVHCPDASAIVELDSVEAILAMVHKGLGMTILPESALVATGYDDLSTRPLEDESARRKLYLVHCVAQDPGRPLAALAEALRATGAGMAARRRSRRTPR